MNRAKAVNNDLVGEEKEWKCFLGGHSRAGGNPEKSKIGLSNLFGQWHNKRTGYRPAPV